MNNSKTKRRSSLGRWIERGILALCLCGILLIAFLHIASYRLTSHISFCIDKTYVHIAFLRERKLPERGFVMLGIEDWEIGLYSSSQTPAIATFRDGKFKFMYIDFWGTVVKLLPAFEFKTWGIFALCNKPARGGLLLNMAIWKLSLPFALVAGLIGLRKWRRHRRIRHRRANHQCEQCGYRLIGNQSGVCPECGAVANSKEVAAPAHSST